eukprot:PhF_6_TR8441/c0_g1_i1/m.13163
MHANVLITEELIRCTLRCTQSEIIADLTEIFGSSGSSNSNNANIPSCGGSDTENEDDIVAAPSPRQQQVQLQQQQQPYPVNLHLEYQPCVFSTRREKRDRGGQGVAYDSFLRHRSTSHQQHPQTKLRTYPPTPISFDAITNIQNVVQSRSPFPHFAARLVPTRKSVLTDQRFQSLVSILSRATECDRILVVVKEGGEFEGFVVTFPSQQCGAVALESLQYGNGVFTVHDMKYVVTSMEGSFEGYPMWHRKLARAVL